MEKTKRYYLSVKILTAIAVLTGVLMAYFIIAAHNKLDFGINWNMFKSVLAWPLFIVGFILGLGQKFQVYESILETRDSSGRVVKRERNDDIMDSAMAGCIMPILSYFVITPLIIAAMIYYTIMVIVYLFAAIFPYIIAGFIVVSILFLYKSLNRLVVNRFRHILIPGLSVFFIFIYWLLYTLWVSGGNDSNTNLAMIISGTAAIVSLAIFTLLIITTKDTSTDILIDEENVSKYTMSRKFLITSIVMSLLIIGVYCFKLLSSPEISQSYLSAQTTSETSNSTTTIPSVEYSDNTVVENIENSTISEEEVSPTLQPETDVNAAKTSGFITSHNVGYDKFYMAKRINQSDRNLLKVDNVNSALPNNELSRGKVIYKNTNGRLETFLHIIEDHNTIEYLVSYNKNGDYIAHVIIGELGAYTGTRAYGMLNGNKLNVYYYYPSESGDEQDENRLISYIVTSQLGFVKR